MIKRLIQAVSLMSGNAPVRGFIPGAGVSGVQNPPSFTDAADILLDSVAEEPSSRDWRFEGGGLCSPFTGVRRQSSNQELLGVTSEEGAQLTIAARWCICGINKAYFAQGRAGHWRHS